MDRQRDRLTDRCTDDLGPMIAIAFFALCASRGKKHVYLIAIINKSVVCSVAHHIEIFYITVYR